MAEPARWPTLMSLSDACKYLTLTRHQFRALITAGVLPIATEPLAGLKLWHRRDLDAASERMFKFETDRKERDAEIVARRAVETFRPPPLRHGNSASRGNLALLPPPRKNAPSSGA